MSELARGFFNTETGECRLVIAGADAENPAWIDVSINRLEAKDAEPVSFELIEDCFDDAWTLEVNRCCTEARSNVDALALPAHTRG